MSWTVGYPKTHGSDSAFPPMQSSWGTANVHGIPIRSPFGGVLCHRSTPSHHPFRTMVFKNHPAIKGDPRGHGHHHFNNLSFTHEPMSCPLDAGGSPEKKNDPPGNFPGATGSTVVSFTSGITSRTTSRFCCWHLVWNLGVHDLRSHIVWVFLKMSYMGYGLWVNYWSTLMCHPKKHSAEDGAVPYWLNVLFASSWVQSMGSPVLRRPIGGRGWGEQASTNAQKWFVSRT